MNGENVEKVYRQCLKRERDRERKWRLADQGEFESSMLSLDVLTTRKHCKNIPTPAEDDAAFAADTWLSDNGKGVEDIIRHCDGELGEPQSDDVLPEWARKKIERNLPKIALEVARLVVRHKDEEKPRRLSLCEIEQWIRDASRKRPVRSTGAT